MCGQVVCGISATHATQSDDRCHLVPRLPRKVKVDVTQCHACHARGRWTSSSATPATRDAAAPTGTRCATSAVNATPATQSEGGCHPVPCLPSKTKVDVTKCHACHARRRGAHRNPLRHQSPPSAVSATPATQSEGGCHPVPRLPRKTKVVTKCHACHARRRGAHGNPLRHQSLCVCKLCEDKLREHKLCEDKLCEDKLVRTRYV